MFIEQLRDRPKLLIFVVVMFLATTGLAFYLWNDVTSTGSWKTLGTNQWRIILLEKESGNFEGTGSIHGDSPVPFTVTGFRTNRFVSFKLHTKDEEVIFQGKLIGRNELTGEITTTGAGEEDGVNFTISLFKE